MVMHHRGLVFCGIANRCSPGPARLCGGDQSWPCKPTHTGCLTAEGVGTQSPTWILMHAAMQDMDSWHLLPQFTPGTH